MERSVAPALDALVRQISRCRQTGDEEAVHQLRISSRRIDAWLWLAGHRTLRGDLGWVRSVAAPLRDLDVRLHTTRDRRLLAEEREPALRRLVAALESSRTQALVDALGVLPPLRRRRANAHLSRLADRALSLPFADADGLHRVRRHARRLRYALEWMGEDIGPLPGLQRALGAVSDALLGGEVAPDAPVLQDGKRAWNEVRAFVARWR